MIAIIGGGAAGLMAGGLLSQSGKEVTIFDGNEKCGKKIYITGKGRCNLTNNCDKEEYLSNVVGGKKFMMGAINRFSPADCIEHFENLGLKLKIERGNRVFPLSDKASDVTKALLSACKGCEIKLNEKVEGVAFDQKGNKFVVKTGKGKYLFDKVIVATGGKTYPLTGSTGDGYTFARKFGHNVIKPCPALCAIELQDKFVGRIMGLPLKNVTLNAIADGKKHSFFGEMMFTDKGITGPIVLTLSSYINRCANVNLSIDFKPALSLEEIDKRLLRDFDANLNKNVTYILRGLLPKNFVDVFLEKVKIHGEKKVNAVTAEERKKIGSLLKRFDLDYKNLYPLESGIITSGGVDLKEINPKTMESKLQKGLYFIGEVLDIDCLTGGFNLQVAFSTAYSCAKSLREEETC